LYSTIFWTGAKRSRRSRDRGKRARWAAFYSAVLTDKNIAATKPIVPDFVGLKLPNRYVFGCGMDVSGAWRNLP